MRGGLDVGGEPTLRTLVHPLGDGDRRRRGLLECRPRIRVVGSVGDADLRRELNAFVDELARRPCRKKGLNGR